MAEKQKSDGDLIGRVLSAAGLVATQAGAVVSRTLINRPVGTVTAFAFDEGQGLSEHTVPYDALVIVLEGQTEVTISGQPHVLNGGGLIIMPAHQPHSVRALAPFKMLLVMIRG